MAKDMADLEKAHEYASKHRQELEKDKVCGCFWCMEIYNPEEIKRWVSGDADPEKQDTALCPRCGVDAVIGESSGYLITKEFLGEMHKYWFDRGINSRALRRK